MRMAAVAGAPCPSSRPADAARPRPLGRRTPQSAATARNVPNAPRAAASRPISLLTGFDFQQASISRGQFLGPGVRAEAKAPHSSKSQRPIAFPSGRARSQTLKTENPECNSVY